MEDKNKLFTNANVIFSVLYVGIPAICAGLIDEYYVVSVGLVTLQCVIFAYLCRYIGLKKGIYTGFWWGFLLSFIGLIILAILPAEKHENKLQTNDNISNLTQSADALKKYKELLDTGVITQEEFDIKKKELLK